MKMIFNTLYVFSPREKMAKTVSFSEGVNVVTSSQADGTDRGKTVLLRSLYHALGADAYFDSKWKAEPKIYILQFSIDDHVYFIFRSGNLFKLFNEQKERISSVIHASDLAAELEKITGFAMKLPNRNENTLEITPPVYNYLPFYIDQDHYDGSKFSSFENLGQYSNYKEAVLFSHFGVYDETFFDLVKQKELIGSDINKLNDRMRVLHAVQEDILAKIGTGAYSGNIDALKRELKQHQREYSEIVDKLNKCKAKLFELRDKSYELTRLISEVNKSERTNDVEIQQLRKHRCPECNSIITDTVRLKSKRFNFAEDIVIVRTEIETSLLDINQSIQTEEARYADLLTTMRLFEERVKMNSTEINDILRYKGLCEIRDSVTAERTEVQDGIDEKENTLKEIEKELKKFADKKKMATARYISILTQERAAFCIEEITIDSIKRLNSVFVGSGSNKNISTIIWYMAIIQVRNEFNKDAVRFPFVIDSPNNVETDDEKKFKVIQYILDHASISPQMIMSAIGFVPEDYSLDDKSINIIYLGNEKWHLLNEQDYHQNYNLLKELSEAL